MNKKTFSIIAVAAASIIALTILTGCSVIPGNNTANAQEPATAVAILLGYHANSRDLNLNSPLVKDTVEEAISAFGFVSVISIDGAPDLINADSYEMSEQYRGNPQLLRDVSKKKAANLLAGLSEVRSNDTEVDTLEALRLAIRTFASAPENAEKIIIVVDTGLSTTGFLDFRNNIINAEPRAVADLLAEKQAIPDFTGVTIRWQQLGDVHAPQKNLTPEQVSKLEAIWRAIIEKTGGTFEPSLTVANPGSISGDLPFVSIVEFPSDEPVVFTPEIINDFDEPQFLSDEQVQFIGDSDQYLHPMDAVAAITPIADYMKANSDFTMLLIGTTAGDKNTDNSLNLSLRRANAVKGTLISLGIAEERIITTGLGCEDPWHIYDVGYDGPLAAQNRKVVLISADTPEAKDILNLK